MTDIEYLGPLEEESKVKYLGPLKEEPVKKLLPSFGAEAIQTLQHIGQVYPAAETAAQLATMLYGLPLSGFAGLAGLPFGKGKEWLETTAKTLIYEPQTEKGRKLSEATFYPIRKLEEKAAAPAGEWAEKKYGPTAGAIAHTAVMGAPLALPLGRMGLKRIPIGKIKTAAEIAKTPESRFVSKEFAERFTIPEVSEGVSEAPKLIKDVVPKPKPAPYAAELLKKPAPFYLRPSEKLPITKSMPLPKNYGKGIYIEPDFPSLKKVAAKKVVQETTIQKLNKFREKKGLKLINKNEVALYSGIPIHKLGEAWVKYIGDPLWDKAVMKGIPKLLEKIPGGKAINRAFLYDYRGDLANTAKYIKDFDAMKRYQSIGREYAVDLGRRLQAFPEEIQLRMGEFIRGEEVKLSPNELKVAVEAKDAMLNLGKQCVDAGLLSEEVFFKNAGRYMPRLYTSKEYQSLLTMFNLKKPTRLDLTRFKTRKDIPKEIRQEMGEILTPGYPIAKGITQLTHDIELAKFFTGISKNPEWAIAKVSKLTKTGEPMKFKVGKKWIEPKIFPEDVKIPDSFKQLPANKKLGELSEAYVHEEIFADLQETIRTIETPERVWRRSLGAWKFGKVIISPKTHVRNLMSNSILAHLGGLPMYEQPVYLTKAAHAMRTKNEVWQAAKSEGIFRRTFTNVEVRGLFDQVEGQLQGIKAGDLPEKFGIIGEGWQKTKIGLGKAAKLYEAEEQWFKMAKMIHNLERKKMSVADAAMDAETWLFNYEKVTRFQEKFRSKWYGAPFCTFTFKAMPRIAEAIIKTPWRFAVPMGIIYALEKAAQRKIGDTAEEIEAKKEIRPEWQRGVFLGTPNFARVPVLDDYGREYYLNLTYILPWGDLAEAGGWGPIPGGIMPFSQPFINEPISQIMNWDKFYEEKIIKEKELAGKDIWGKAKVQVKKRGQHIIQALAPTLVMDFAKVFSSLRGRPDYRGRMRPRGVVLADVLAGVKMYPVDYTDQMVREISRLSPRRGYLAKKIRADIKTLTVKRQALKAKGKGTGFIDKQIKEKFKQIIGLGKEVEKLSETYKKIK